MSKRNSVSDTTTKIKAFIFRIHFQQYQIHIRSLHEVQICNIDTTLMSKHPFYYISKQGSVIISDLKKIIIILLHTHLMFNT